MALTILSRRCEISEELKKYVEEKVLKFHHFFDEEGISKIEVSVEQKASKNKDHYHTVQITLLLTGKTILRVEESEATVHASVDVAVKKMEEQIRRYKSRKKSKIRENRKFKHNIEKSSFQTSEDDEQAEVSADLINVKRIKRFEVAAMTVADAIDQMEFLSHTFFIFVNTATNKLSVVYKRRTVDGEYGLLEPEWT